MKHLSHMHWIEEMDDNTPEDELDQLFMQLEQIEPPSSLVENILTSVSRLPRPHLLHEELEGKVSYNNFEGLIIRTHLQPS